MAIPRAPRPLVFLVATLALGIVALFWLDDALGRTGLTRADGPPLAATWHFWTAGFAFLLLGAAVLTLFMQTREWSSGLVTQNDRLEEANRRLQEEVATRKRAEEASRESAARLEAVVGQMPVILWTTDAELRITASMGAGLASIGERPDQFAGRRLQEALGSEDPAFLPLAAHLRALAGESVTYEMPWKGRSFRTHIEPLRDAGGKITGCLGTCFDITDQMGMVEALRREKETAQAYLDTVDVIVVVIGRDERVQLVNPKGCALLGYSEGEIVGKNWFDTFLPERVRKGAKHVFTQIMAGEIEAVRYHEIAVLTRAGAERLIAWKNAAIHDEQGRVTATISSGDDITHRKIAEKQLHELNTRLETANRELERLTLVDPLSDLLNRRGLQRVLTQEIQRVVLAKHPLAAILIDLDNFKQINDRYGHAVGDVVIAEVARKLKECLRVTDHACRIGGDEFMMLLPDTRPAEASAVAERIRLAIASAPIMHSSSPVHVTASLGAVLVSETVASIDELLSLTHLLLYESKHAGKNRASYDWGDALEEKAAHGNAMSKIVMELQRGDHFRIVAHPIVRLSDEKTVGVELLTRSSLPSFESPADFFRIAQAVNIMTLVDHQCFRKCLAASLNLPPEIHCHLNIFPSTLIDIPVTHILDDFPKEADPKRYCVELSEQQIIGDPSHLLESVRALKARGIQVAIDDVGFGKSCLENLILLEPDVIKIDRKCIFGVGRDKARERSLKRLLDTAAGLGSLVVAEGVETREDMEILKHLGVPEAQGYLWSMPAEIKPLAKA